MINLSSPVRQTGVDSTSTLNALVGKEGKDKAEKFLSNVKISHFQGGKVDVSLLLKKDELTPTAKTLIQTLSKATNSTKVYVAKGQDDSGTVLMFRKGTDSKDGEYGGALFIPGKKGESLRLDSTATSLKKEYTEKNPSSGTTPTTSGSVGNQPSTVKTTTKKVVSQKPTTEPKKVETPKVEPKKVETPKVETKGTNPVSGTKTESVVPTKSGYVTVKGLPRSIDEKKVDLINKKMLAREDGKIMEYGFDKGMCCSKAGVVTVGGKQVSGQIFLLQSSSSLSNGVIRKEKFFVSDQFLEASKKNSEAKPKLNDVIHMKISEGEIQEMQDAFANRSQTALKSILKEQAQKKETLVKETKTSQENTSQFVRSQKLTISQQNRLNEINGKMREVNFTMAKSDKSGPKEHQKFAEILKGLSKSDVEIWSLNSLPFIEGLGQTLVKNISSEKFCTLVECFAKVSREAASKLGSELGKVIAEANEKKDTETLKFLTGHLVAFSKVANDMNGELILSTAAVNLTGPERKTVDEAINQLKTRLSKK